MISAPSSQAALSSEKSVSVFLRFAQRRRSSLLRVAQTREMLTPRFRSRIDPSRLLPLTGPFPSHFLAILPLSPIALRRAIAC